MNVFQHEEKGVFTKKKPTLHTHAFSLFFIKEKKAKRKKNAPCQFLSKLLFSDLLTTTLPST